MKKNIAVIQNVLLSCVGSLAAFLLVRWVSAPTYAFTRHLLVYLCGAAVFSVAGYFLSGLNKVIRTQSSSWGGRRMLGTLIIKEAGQLVLLLSGLAGHLEPGLVILAVFSDFIFSAIALVYPKILTAQVHREAKDIRNLPTTASALIWGCTQDSVDYARQAEKSGRYNVVGLLSNDPAWEGKVIDNYVVYYARKDADITSLQWRLGGIDAILIPKKEISITDAGGDGDIPEVVMKDHMNKLEHFFKRSFDVALSGLLMLVFSPLFVICWLAVLIEDGRPVIYRQERIGLKGRPFGIMKFRTMRNDAEKDGPELYAGDNDPRLTRVGKFLREHHLDEIPQLWNVFCGEMSFVGYRPERRYYINQITKVNPRYRYLYQIRPGVTSYATLYNGYTDSLDKMLVRLDMDLYYLRNHSIFFDFRILGLTFLSIVAGKKF